VQLNLAQLQVSSVIGRKLVVSMRIRLERRDREQHDVGDLIRCQQVLEFYVGP
jgi:hypothetical protein